MNRVSTSHALGDCPACGKPITGSLVLEAQGAPSQSDGSYTLAVRLLGLSISHDCVPSVTRGNGPVREMIEDG